MQEVGHLEHLETKSFMQLRLVLAGEREKRIHSGKRVCIAYMISTGKRLGTSDF